VDRPPPRREAAADPRTRGLPAWTPPPRREAAAEPRTTRAQQGRSKRCSC